MYSASNTVIEWLLVVKMLEIQNHLFRYSAIPLFFIPRFISSQGNGSGFTKMLF